MRRTLALAGWLAGLGLVTAGVHLLGTGPLAAPPATAAGLASWLASSDPLIATMALLRLVLLAGCWYLIAVTLLGVVVRVGRVARLVRLADAVSPRFVQRLLHRSLGLSVATAMLTAGLPSLAGIATDRVVAAASTGDEGHGGAGDDLHVAPTADPRPLPLRLLTPDRSPSAPAAGPATPPATGQSTPATGPATAPSAPATGPATAPSALAGAAATHLVVLGDSFWRIAVDATTVAWGRPPSSREVVAFWREIVEVNRGRLVDPQDPDLILPGQRFELPAVPPAPS